jgi:hypothetical protein
MVRRSPRTARVSRHVRAAGALAQTPGRRRVVYRLTTGASGWDQGTAAVEPSPSRSEIKIGPRLGKGRTCTPPPVRGNPRLCPPRVSRLSVPSRRPRPLARPRATIGCTNRNGTGFASRSSMMVAMCASTRKAARNTVTACPACVRRVGNSASVAARLSVRSFTRLAVCDLTRTLPV